MCSNIWVHVLLNMEPFACLAGHENHDQEAISIVRTERHPTTTILPWRGAVVCLCFTSESTGVCREEICLQIPTLCCNRAAPHQNSFPVLF